MRSSSSVDHFLRPTEKAMKPYFVKWYYTIPFYFAEYDLIRRSGTAYYFSLFVLIFGICSLLYFNDKYKRFMYFFCRFLIPIWKRNILEDKRHDPNFLAWIIGTSVRGLHIYQCQRRDCMAAKVHAG